MATLTGDITADETEVPVSSDTGAGYYTVGSEAVRILGVVDPLVPGLGDGPTGKRHALRGLAGTTKATHSSGATLTQYYPDAATAGGGVTNPLLEPFSIEPAAADATAALQIVPAPDADPNDFTLNVKDLSGGDAFTVTADGQVQIIPDEIAPFANLFLITDSRAVAAEETVVQITRGASALLAIYTTGLTQFSALDATGGVVILQQVAADRAFQVVGDSGNQKRFAVDSAGRYRTFAISAPADADVATSEMVVWFDDTNGAAKLMVKAKSADGTVVSGALALAP